MVRKCEGGENAAPFILPKVPFRGHTTGGRPHDFFQALRCLLQQGIASLLLLGLIVVRDIHGHLPVMRLGKISTPPPAQLLPTPPPADGPPRACWDERRPTAAAHRAQNPRP